MATAHLPGLRAFLAEAYARWLFTAITTHNGRVKGEGCGALTNAGLAKAFDDGSVLVTEDGYAFAVAWFAEHDTERRTVQLVRTWDNQRAAAIELVNNARLIGKRKA